MRFLGVILFTGTLVYLNEAHDLIKDQIIEFPHLIRVPLYFVLFYTIYLVTSFIACGHIKHKKEFFLLAAIAFLINAFDQSYYLLWQFKSATYSSPALKEAVISFATQAVSIGSVILPMVLFYFFTKNRSALPGFYGLTFRNHPSVKPYLFILALMSVLIGFSAFTSGISSYYPTLKRSGLVTYASELGLSRAAAIAIFETVYASDFISVELFFRGLLIFVFSRFLGNQVMLPMAACYCIFHFGKPLLETISSFFGGYILGVFALYTRNIWGGIIVHMGTALLMELFASLV